MTQPSEHLTAVTLNIFRLNGILYEWGNRFAAPLGLNTSRWQVLGAVLLSDMPPTVPQIAEKMGITRQGRFKRIGAPMQRKLPNSFILTIWPLRHGYWGNSDSFIRTNSAKNRLST